MRYASLILCGGLAVMLSGCLGASNDPHQGGLFGYSPQAYQQRLQERNEQLSYMQGENERMAKENAGLEKKRSARSAEVDALARKDKAMRGELAELDKTLKASGKAEGADAARLADLRQRRSALEGRMDAARAEEDVDSRRRELDELRRELDALEKEADSLSRM